MSPEQRDPFDYPSSHNAEVHAPEYDAFRNLKEAVPDPILGMRKIKEAILAKDSSAEILDLSVGIIKNSEGEDYTFSAVAKAKNNIGMRAAPDDSPKYLPQGGDKDFVEATLRMIFGTEHPLLKEPHRERIAALGVMGGTNGLFVTAELFQMLEEDTGKKVQLIHGSPTWPNHLKIFGKKHGFQMISFKHLDDNNVPSIDNLRAKLEVLEKTRDKSRERLPVVLLQGVCHNPTGLDYSPEQIEELIRVLKQNKAHAIVDTAYHGLGNGFEEDSLMMRRLAESGVPTIITYSLSKNQSAYQDRTGLIISVNQNADVVKRVQSRAEQDAVRPSTSNPAAHGEMVTVEILKSKTLTAELAANTAQARDNINSTRAKIAELTAGRFPTIRKGKGLFSLTGLNPKQVEQLGQAHFNSELNKNVYILMTKDGRMNIAAVPSNRIELLSERMNEVYDKANESQ